ncbi:hypothetical protein PPEV_gp094 [Pseudomonas phage EL]|uniref:Uncharacterized protein n=1 Tax=Pseudomonas phage EL TaxID=273133 RepID=Q2Z0Y7_9CAUD|nr:hypothetical protein PPEV_gp094 [Pseudomonas phage EL]CAG27188.1 hypothetical protein [Pseudomonas phage EL]
MPSVSRKQANLMRDAAHSAEFAKKVGIDHEVAKHWYEEDKKVGWFDPSSNKAESSKKTPSKSS